MYEGRFGGSDWVIAEHADGKVRLHHTKETGAARGLGEGAMLGGLAGILVGSVFAAALLAGVAASGLHRDGTPKDAMNEIGGAVTDGETALFIPTDSNSARIITRETFASSPVRIFTVDAN